MDQETVAFIIVTWNNRDIIAGCLDSVLEQTGVHPEIYVLDNGSSDDTVGIVRGYPQVHLVESTENLGFARGNNELIRQALSDVPVRWVALVNSDAVLDPDWTANILGFVAGRPGVAGVQGLTVDYYDHDMVDSQHIYVSKRLQGIQYGYKLRADRESYFPRKVFGVNAAAAMFSREYIENQPDPDCYFFDERFYMYYEDVDVAYRSLVAGYDSYFVPSSVAYHMGSVSANKMASMYTVTMTARNHLAVVYKNTPWPVIVKSMPDFVAGIRDYLRQVRHDHGWTGAWQVLGTYISEFFRLPVYARSRRAIRKRTRLGADYLRAIMRQDGIRG
ncbi:MAG: glycosyltransferase family 2 protein [Propionibacteriaceae bacterium]|nr:glycosyltransferase family 2 protein [Propionibacteriaceae bacterium]